MDDTIWLVVKEIRFRLRMGQRSPYCLPLPVKTPKSHQPPPTSTGTAQLATNRNKHPSNVPFSRSLGSEKSPATETPIAAGSSGAFRRQKELSAVSTGFIINVYGGHEYLSGYDRSRISFRKSRSGQRESILDVRSPW
uniref:AlNc14C37G3232 protein n=1 Tax=Albugo laibachii Nc14 TaxID=890382 RepID=F0W8V7_9STRA|nr:AlNc14C37G3232 [Albugo laibachii Nc14]|eukprot:CCA17568.1 AlNc14C37G3232 [Albugo laibachii Nc14]